MTIQFKIIAQDGMARVGELITDHGVVPTPTITLNYTNALENWGFKPEDITEARDVILLRNTFWLKERGISNVREGVEWPRPVMSDSGGFQMVSMGKHLKQSFRGLEFDLDSRKIFIAPHEVVEWGKSAEVDLIMPLDNTVYTMDRNPLKFIWSAVMTAVWFRYSRKVADDKNHVLNLYQKKISKDRAVPFVIIHQLYSYLAGYEVILRKYVDIFGYGMPDVESQEKAILQR